MTSVDKIQAKINRGFGKVGSKLGTNYQFFRPAPPGSGPGTWGYNTWDAGAVWDDEDPVPTPIGGYSISGGQTWGEGVWDADGTWEGADQRTVALPVSLNAEDWTYKKPSKYGKATWYAAFDPTNVKVGDYLVGTRGIFFVADLSPILSILVVECNRTIDVLRPQTQKVNGLGAYGGNTDDTEKLMMQAWPCSILQGGARAELTEAQLPGDKREPGWTILLPYYSGTTIRTGDIIKDDLKRRMVVGSAELTSAGWRLTAMQAVS